MGAIQMHLFLMHICLILGHEKIYCPLREGTFHAVPEEAFCPLHSFAVSG